MFHGTVGAFRRTRLLTLALGLSLCAGAGYAAEAEPVWHHATALNGTPKYGPDATHFDYVNPDAPKGGLVRLSTQGGFDTFNVFLPRGNLAPGLGLIYDTLKGSSLDELDISAQYGVIATETRSPDDYSWVEFKLNENARWHDGEPITAEDVVWSFETATEQDPRQKFYYQNVVSAEAISDHHVRFTFDAPGNRELPHIMGQLLILPKHWWQGTDADGNPRDISRGTLEPPLGSGPYRIKDFSPNRTISYERVEDYWAADLPVNVGTNNFDEIRYESFRDTAVLLEAFKADQYDWRTENSAKNWATGYDFPAAREGKVVQEVFEDKARGVMQAFVPNLRREKFSDPRVRKALNLAFDFESANRTVFFDQYKRIYSYFAGTELASSGLPEGRELEILEEVRELVPPEVFTTPYENPVGGSPQQMRTNLREAVRLLQEAGYRLENRTLVGPDGEPFTIEFIAEDPSSERYVLPYANNLRLIGIEMTTRVLDTPQYINRIQSRDFDMATLVWRQSLSPGNEQRDYWGSEAADRPQSRNYAGIKDEGVDALIDKVVFAKYREELVAATRALDRVLLANNFVIPQFYSGTVRTARWNRFSHPETMPDYSVGFPTIWWYDEEKAAQTGAPS